MKRDIIILSESLWQSILADTITFLSLVAAVGIGKWIGSNALQWMAGLMVIWVIVTIKVKWANTFYSIQEAREHLDFLEKSTWSASQHNNDALRHTQQDNI